MTANEWIQQVLAPKITDNVIYFPAPGEQAESSVDVPVFEIIFGPAVSAELEKPQAERDFYAALSGAHTFEWEGQQLTMTAAEMGYQAYFDQWHIEGLIYGAPA